MHYGGPEYNSQIYESRGGEASVPSWSSAAHHQLQGGSVRDSRMHNRYEDPREHGRYGFGRSGSSGQKNRKGLLGLSNLGNTCFMNAALQCLTHTHGLQKYFRFCSHAYTAKNDASGARGPTPRQKLLNSFAHWFERDWGKNVSASFHSPEDILRAVQQLNPIFQGYAQQDAQEFLRCVLDNIHEELRREIPDDLHTTFGVDLCPSGGVPPGVASCSNSGGANCSTDPRQPPGRSAGDASGSEPVSPTRRSASAASHLMQLCQATEGVTDVGEIRLPAAKPAAPPPANAGPGHAVSSSPGSAWESGSGMSSSSAATTPTSAAFSNSHAPGTASAQPGAQRRKEGEQGGDQKEKSEGEKPTHFSSIVSELFQGHVVSTVRCLECGHVSRTKEPFQDVSVQIPNPNELPNGQIIGGSPMHSLSAPEMGANGGASGSKGPTIPGISGMLGNVTGKVKSWFYDKGVDITDCLRKFCAPEYLVGKDKYDCENCKRKTDAERRFAFKDLPEVLCIHIKRFRYDASWFNATKNSRVVTFPVKGNLDMGPFLEDPPAYPVEYRLIGLIQHIGSMGGGHYISYCRHKRSPQEWYEFDDMQVNTVSAETVERAEPYVLFFQRVPSKGSKYDRQTFKADCASMQARIREYLMRHPPPAPLGSAAASHLPGAGRHGFGSEEAVAEEMRFHGPALRNLYRCPPAELDMVFVTKHWYVKLTTMSHPGPIDNFHYLGPYGKLGFSSVEMAAEPFIPISRDLYRSLVQKYGGGPAIETLDICPKCQAHLRAYNDRKQAEYELVSKYDTKDTGDGKGWYLVDAVWVNKWKSYIKTDHVMDIRDMMHPGPVSNRRLCDRKTGQIRSGLRLRIDYIGVNARVWWLFQHFHGGGPAVCREELDIYSAGHRVEDELRLEELRAIGDKSDFSRRMHHKFVDECKGDLELFQERYGQGTPDGCEDQA